MHHLPPPRVAVRVLEKKNRGTYRGPPAGHGMIQHLQSLVLQFR